LAYISSAAGRVFFLGLFEKHHKARTLLEKPIHEISGRKIIIGSYFTARKEY
jgi:hypothetical protein